MKKILIFCVFFSSSILLGAAASTIVHPDGSMAQLAPYIELMMRPTDYISDVTYFAGNDQERKELVCFAQSKIDANKHVFSFLSYFLQKIYSQNLTLENLCKDLCRYPLAHEDRITFTNNVAQIYLAAESMHDAIHRLTLEMQSAVMNDIFRSAAKSSLKIGVDTDKSLEEILARLIWLEKKSITMSREYLKSEFLAKALHQSAVRGVKLEFIAKKIEAGDTRNNVMSGANNFVNEGYIFFECNLDDKPIVIQSKCERTSVPNVLSESLFVDTDVILRTFCNRNVQNVRSASSTRTPIDFEQKKEFEECLKISPAADLLSKALESIWRNYFCAPVKVKSFEDSRKRQRRC